eukprot:5980268-Pleurochrysis_carterae.AAC.4
MRVCDWPSDGPSFARVRVCLSPSHATQTFTLHMTGHCFALLRGERVGGDHASQAQRVLGRALLLRALGCFFACIRLDHCFLSGRLRLSDAAPLPQPLRPHSVSLSLPTSVSATLTGSLFLWLTRSL